MKEKITNKALPLNIDKYGMFPKGNYHTKHKHGIIMNELLVTPFNIGVDRFDNMSWYNKRPLMSYSRAFKGLSEYTFAPIPKQYLERAINEGKNLMVNLETFFNNDVKDLSYMKFETAYDRDYLELLLDWFKEHKIKMLGVEKCIRTKNWIAYLDVLVKQHSRNFIIEIKTRNDNKVRKTDIQQMAVYFEMTQLPIMLVILNKKKMKITFSIFNRLKQSLNTLDFSMMSFNEALDFLGYPAIGSYTEAGIGVVDKILDDGLGDF